MENLYSIPEEIDFRYIDTLSEKEKIKYLSLQNFNICNFAGYILPKKKHIEKNQYTKFTRRLCIHNNPEVIFNITSKSIIPKNKDLDERLLCFIAKTSNDSNILYNMHLILRHKPIESVTNINASLSQNKHTPKDLLFTFASHKDMAVRTNAIINLIINHTNLFIKYICEYQGTKQNVLKKLYNDDNNLCYIILENNNVPPDLLECIAGREKEVGILYKIAKNKNIPYHLLIKLSTHKHPAVLSGVAKNIKTPLNILYKLAKTNLKEVLCPIIQHKNSNIDLLKHILYNNNNHNIEVLCAFAKNNNITKDIVQYLSNYNSYCIDKCLSKNTATTEDILCELAQLRGIEIRNNIAKNPSTPAYILDFLSQQKHNTILLSAIENKNITKDILTRLTNHPSLLVQKKAVKFLKGKNGNPI